jgi:hypothetical protein
MRAEPREACTSVALPVGASHWNQGRPDLAGVPLQVGLYHASYGGESSYITFSDFKLTTRK